MPFARSQRLSIGGIQSWLLGVSEDPSRQGPARDPGPPRDATWNGPAALTHTPPYVTRAVTGSSSRQCGCPQPDDGPLRRHLTTGSEARWAALSPPGRYCLPPVGGRTVVAVLVAVLCVLFGTGEPARHRSVCGARSVTPRHVPAKTPPSSNQARLTRPSQEPGTVPTTLHILVSAESGAPPAIRP